MSTIGLNLTPSDLVLQSGCDFSWVFTNLDDNKQPTNFEPGELLIELDTGGATNAQQEVLVYAANGGTYTLSLDGHTTPPIAFYDITADPFTIADEITQYIEALSNVGTGNVKVYPASMVPGWNIQLALTDSADEVQQITFSGTVPTSGTFRLAYGTVPTVPIAYGADPSVVKSALEDIVAIGVNNTNVTALDGGGYQVKFVGTKANTDMLQITAYTAGVANNDAGGSLFGLLDAIGAFLSGLIGFLTGGASTPTQSTAPTTTVVTTTVVPGQAKLNEPLVTILESALSGLFNSKASLQGVNITFAVDGPKHVTLIATALRSFTETQQLLFDVAIDENEIEGAVSAATALAGVIASYTVYFYWSYSYVVEFINGMGNLPVNQIVVDDTELTGEFGKQKIYVSTLNPGKRRWTWWPFTIDGSSATIKVDSDDVDLILPRTPWKLVFLPEDETVGGTAVAIGRTTVQ